MLTRRIIYFKLHIIICGIWIGEHFYFLRLSDADGFVVACEFGNPRFIDIPRTAVRKRCPYASRLMIEPLYAGIVAPSFDRSGEHVNMTLAFDNGDYFTVFTFTV